MTCDHDVSSLETQSRLLQDWVSDLSLDCREALDTSTDNVAPAAFGNSTCAFPSRFVASDLYRSTMTSAMRGGTLGIAASL